MKRCDLMDLKDILPIIENERHLILKMFEICLQNDGAYIYINKDKNAVMMYLPIDEYKYNAHIYSLKSARGKGLKGFAISSGLDLVKNTNCTTVMNFVDKGNRMLQLFMGAIGATRVGLIKDSCSGGDTILYCSYKEDF